MPISKDKSSDSRVAVEISRPPTKTIHPPIESHFQLPQPSSSSSGFKSKFMSSVKKKITRTKSTMVALQGVHDPKDELQVQSFRQLLFLDNATLHLPHTQDDYHTLLRFLRMRDFDFGRAKEAFLNYLKWREAYGVDAIPKEFKFPEYDKVKQFYPHGYHGIDRYGRPVYIERIGMVDVDELLKVTTVDRFVKYHVSEQEKTLNLRYPACSISSKKHVASSTSILDVHGVSLANFSKPARAIFTEIQKIDSNYYPETLHRLFIVNAGSSFKILWKAVKAFLDARTLTKIQVLGYNYLNELLNVVDISNLPSFLGGNCTCAQHGGCLFSDIGPWNNADIKQIVDAVSASENENTGDEEVASKGNMKLQALEAALAETKTKIEALEAQLEETKTALEGLSLHMEDLRCF